jgi:GGDEF domain-containing protein
MGTIAKPDSDSTSSFIDAIRQADAARYKAKRDGGNRAYVSLQRL